MKIFVEVVLPVLLIFLAGYGLQKWEKLNIKSISTFALYILIPGLVFRTFYNTELNVQYMNIVLFSFVLMFLLILVAKVYSKMRKTSRSIESGLILSTAFMNSGNYGAPIILFAYGEAGFHYSITLLVLHAIMMNFFGVYYAARGKAGIKTAVKSVLEMPTTYVVVIAIAFQLLNVPVSKNILSAVDLVADATIPVVMLILGMQLAEIKLRGFHWERITFAIVSRLFLSPILAYLIIQFMAIDPLLEKVLIVTSAMPSAVNTVMYALQFDAEPEFVSSITFITTLLSIFTITPLLFILG
ncbi:AEC family transporter [Tepidibacillus decaturensis]|uniref:Transporter n=1 Tax=Tepidibacillus decaturensis TaxID=1413211 RepID=A0A135L5S3_9BACI|nr:AEC family transporter [Tepidibacillus decaturensis]KXG44364.1 transporter [Tepidibacillus decaturensis]